MAINLNDNIKVLAGKPTDARYLNNLAPYVSELEANTAISGIQRYTGLTVNIAGAEYWYKDGIADACLIPKLLGGGGTVSGATNGLGIINNKVCLGGILSNNTTVNISGRTLTFSGSTGKMLSCVGNLVNYAYTCVSDAYVTLETQNSTNGAYIDLNRTGNTITTCAKGGNLLYCTNRCMIITAPSGATYSADYSAYFTANSLVTKKYVDISQNNFCVNYTLTDPYDMSTDLVTGFVGVSGVSCILLPSSPILGRQLTISDICGNALSDPIYIDGNGTSIAGNGCAIINTDFGSITFLHNGYHWSPIAFVN